MKRRSREINIFSLSMMDVISGAMGAFLIIVVVLSRYYQSDPANSKSIQQLQENIEQARQRMQRAEDMVRQGGDTQELMRQLEEARRDLHAAQQQTQQLRHRLDEASSQLDRLNKRVDQLDSENAQLERRRPYLVYVDWECPQLDVDLYLENDGSDKSGLRMPRFDPDAQQYSFWSGDTYVDDPSSPGVDVWQVRDVVPEMKNKLFLKLHKDGPTQANCTIRGYVFGPDTTIELPETTLNGSNPWLLLGYLVYTTDDKIQFIEAQASERAVERKNVETRVRTASSAAPRQQSGEGKESEKQEKREASQQQRFGDQQTSSAGIDKQPKSSVAPEQTLEKGSKSWFSRLFSN